MTSVRTGSRPKEAHVVLMGLLAAWVNVPQCKGWVLAWRDTVTTVLLLIQVTEPRTKGSSKLLTKNKPVATPSPFFHEQPEHACWSKTILGLTGETQHLKL